MPQRFGEKDFAKHLNTKFRVRLDGVENAPEVSIELDEVKPFPDLTHSRGDLERFSLYFYGPGDILLPQRIYTLEHEQMGTLEIFLVPVGQEQRGVRYEAVFSYFKDLSL